MTGPNLVSLVLFLVSTHYTLTIYVVASCSTFGRVKRSENAQFIHDSDVRILGLSPNGENTWKIEFAVLFPSVDGKAPQPSKPEELIQMVDENKKGLEKAFGGSIERITIGK